jgi:poly-gamma-glutamate capsule biosynthesis protein CapA/YwtB (metallophosphatase superfamily)
MSNDGLRAAFTGDSLITRGLTHNRDDETSALYDLIRGSDVGFTNLETVPNNFVGHPVQDAGGTHLGAHEWVLDELEIGGFNLFSASNNHSLNYGVAGLLELIRIMNRRGLRYSGIGTNLAEARAPVYLDTDAGSVALISCASTFARGQQASDQRPDVQGRPGLNPLRYTTTYTVSEEQMRVLRQLAEELGLERKRLERISMGFGFPPHDPDEFPFLGESFVVGESTRVDTSPHAEDLEAIASWVPEAKARANVVIVSIHAHEDSGDKETPADFLRAFAHRMIDEGADIIVGHGPHLIRGMEMYCGVPIFYSLGNLIGQNELTYKLPSDSYEAFRVDRDRHAGYVFHQRSEAGTQGFPADPRYWQTIVPVCVWSDGSLASIEIYPVTLRLGDHPGSRGKPALAVGDEAQIILDRFARLSSSLGTDILNEEFISMRLPGD